MLEQGRITGGEFFSQIEKLPVSEREEAIVRAVVAGQVPNHLQQLAEVRYHAKDSHGQDHEVVVFVSKDYLAVGTDEDFRRVPLSPLAAQQIADRLNMTLPTKMLVDRVYHAAQTKVAPQPLPWGPAMTGVAYFAKHENILAGQLSPDDSGTLRAGHKKDVILSPRLLQSPRQVAIYGWHRMNGRRIQPVCLIHGDSYADYSHGIRLVAKTILVDGVERNLEAVMADSNLHSLVSDDGPITVNTYRRVLVGLN